MGVKVRQDVDLILETVEKGVLLGMFYDVSMLNLVKDRCDCIPVIISPFFFHFYILFLD